MTPNDYYKAAEKHLECCLNWYNKTKGEYSKDCELLEVYYLLGYVAECFTVYTVYRFGHWNPKGEISGSPKSRVGKAMNIDIEDYFDPVFAYHTGYDFFDIRGWKQVRSFYRQIKEITCVKKERREGEYSEDFTGEGGKQYSIIWQKIANGDKCNSKDTLHKVIVGGGEINEKKKKNNIKFHTLGHDFQNVIKNVICSKLFVEAALNNVTFFDSYKNKNNDAFKLLKEWNPKIRYYSSVLQWEKEGHSPGIVTRENIARLMEVLKILNRELKDRK